MTVRLFFFFFLLVNFYYFFHFGNIEDILFLLWSIKYHKIMSRFFCSVVISWPGKFGDHCSCENSYLVFILLNFSHWDIDFPSPHLHPTLFCRSFVFSLLWESSLTLSPSFSPGNDFNICGNFYPPQHWSLLKKGSYCKHCTGMGLISGESLFKGEWKNSFLLSQALMNVGVVKCLLQHQ